MLFSEISHRLNEGGAASAARYRTNDQKGLRAFYDWVRQWVVKRNVRPILLAGEESDHRPALFGGHVANRPTQGWMSVFQRIEDRPLGDGAADVQLDYGADAGQRSKVRRQDNPYHASV
jgi:hypothetical protein